MPRTYTKVEQLAAEVFKRKEAGETNRQMVLSRIMRKLVSNSGRM